MSTEILLLAALLLGACTLWHVATRFAPDLFRSHARYKLWQVRDEVWDETYHGALPEAHGRRLVEVSERLIAASDELSMTKLFLLRLFVSPNSNKPLFIDTSDLPESQARLIHGYEDRILLASGMLVFLGNASGIIYSAIKIMVSWIASLFKRRLRDVAAIVLREETCHTLEDSRGFLANLAYHQPVHAGGMSDLSGHGVK